MPGPAIETQQLVREFKKGPRAVDGIDLRVEPGEVYGFLGPNGAGKSTAVHMLTTLLPPTSGRAWVAGHDVVEEGSEVRANIGAALQEAALDPYLTGREHMKLQTALHGMPRADARERADVLLERVGLVQAADRRIKGYSGGMKRRLDLASALVHRPEVLFLDEPTTGLDPVSRLTVWDEVRRINRRGTTVFLTTQYLEEADQLCDRLAIIDGGLIVREGTPALFLVEDIEGGYFDKLRAAPVRRTAIVLGRLIAESVKGVLIATALVLLGLAFGISIASGPLGFVLLVGLTALWSVVYVGLLQLV